LPRRIYSVGFHGTNFRPLAALVHGDLPAQTLGASARSPEGRGPSAVLAASDPPAAPSDEPRVTGAGERASASARSNLADPPRRRSSVLPCAILAIDSLPSRLLSPLCLYWRHHARERSLEIARGSHPRRRSDPSIECRYPGRYPVLPTAGRGDLGFLSARRNEGTRCVPEARAEKLKTKRRSLRSPTFHRDRCREASLVDPGIIR